MSDSVLPNLDNTSPAEDESVVFSIGENCLTDNILSRHCIKSFSSPYSSGRTNIEYILAFEKEQFADLLNKDYLNCESFDNTKVVRNKKYVNTSNVYHSTVMNGFEFTHHDVLHDQEMNDKIHRRYQRLIDLNDKKIALVYHHRYCEQTNIEKLLSDVFELCEVYRKRGNIVSAYVFTQVIVPDQICRKVEKEIREGVHFYRFYTMNVWSGDDQDVFWARCDDDLLKVMIDDISAFCENRPNVD